MRSNETLLTLIFGALSLIAWWFPSIDLNIKLGISAIAAISILFILFKDKLSYFFRKNWQLLISITMLLTFFLLFKKAYPDLLLPAAIVLLTSISITLLLIFKYRQPVVYKTKELIQTFAMNSLWQLNHWGSNCSSLVDNKMIFTGTSAPNGTDGSHQDFLDHLEIGSTYEVICFVKSTKNTTGKFQLWCHDNSGAINVVSVSTPYKTPSTKGEIISLIFEPQSTKNIRIHLQYTPGAGQIEVSYVKILKLTD
jgi:hypothetical protein